MTSSATHATPISSLRASLSSTAPNYPRRLVGFALVLCAMVLIVLTAALSYRVISNFDGVKPEASDNVGWSLSQVEVEASDFQNAVNDALFSSDKDLSYLRLRFDILYSRVNTLRTSPYYRQVDQITEFPDALARTWDILQDTVPVIDGSDANLVAALPLLDRRAADLRETTRTLSISGLTFFALTGDANRAAISTMLQQLAGLALSLFVTLAALTVYVLSIYRKSRARGIALAQANQRMQTILTTSLDAVLVTDLTGRVLEFNAAAERILGYSFEEVRGRQIIEMVSPDHMLQTHMAAAERIRNREADTIEGKGRVTLTAKRASGELFPIELSINRADDGQQELFIAFLHDISKRVSAENELLETRDRALAGERAKAEFLTMMSHEIRTPLNGVLGNLTLLADTDLTSAQTRYLRNMDISGRLLMRHVDSVLDIARFQAGKLEFDIASTDLNALLSELIDSQSGQAGNQGTELHWHWVGAPMPWGRTDRSALEQVLLNLLGNAIKFTPDGCVTVEIEKLPDLEGDKPIIEFRVIDTGIGISPNDVANVFDDFVTSDTSFGRAIGGTGLGLGITRRIVQGLGGTIGVETAPGEGATFWVRLPMEQGRAPGTAKTSSQEDAVAARMSVLLVEDNAINREVATELLEKDGHTVVPAADGQAGVDQAAQTPFDLILMDITMPGMDGLQATRAIRCGNGASRNVPIIAVSANIQPQERDRFIAAGMNGFLPKPLSLQEMRGAMADMQMPPQAKTAPLIDTIQLAANRDGMGDAIFGRLLTRFIAEAEALIAETAPLQDDALGAIATRLHTVAGSAAVFGAAHLRQTLLQAEASANAKNETDTRHHLDQLPAIWGDTKSALTSLAPAA
ncbi:Aerobic respiration control sensor protein ArcB [Shimia sp. SK013]|uniref:hybrid sensor histidine kinase/response regulator n=1 Tax=Shimia sp. SK013 TaxID=1389006 RepID=UPI0006B6980E|nr:ATP-binding protein [Shimia sp. SK013]KPA21009.1 Aerobic respiration control sensor protein ArcB [Shimia sp. SK013]